MKFIKSLVLKIRFIWLGIKSIFKLNLGDKVKYQGRKCVLTQGVYAPMWHIYDLKTKERFEFVNKDYFKKMFLANIIWDIKSTYRFYMNYWYSIFMRNIPLRKCFIVDYMNWIKYKENN